MKRIIFGLAAAVMTGVFAEPLAVTHDCYGGNTKTWQVYRHGQKLAAVKASGAKIVFIGDSITHFWESKGEAQLKKYFSEGDMKMLNLGTSGDRTEHVLWRLDEGGELDGYEAKFIALMIGTNNTGHRPIDQEKPEDTVAGIKAILDLVRAKQPNAIVALTAIFPRGAGEKDQARVRNEKVNAAIEKFADGEHVFWVDFGDRLIDYRGDTKFIMPDRLHPEAAGYEIWYEELKPYIDYALSDRTGAKPKARKRYDETFWNSLWPMALPDDIALWPEGKIPCRIHDEPTRILKNENKANNLILTDVNTPYMRFFPAPGEGVKPCVVICPGGGYFQIGMNKEGSEIAEWLNSLGFSAFVLAYRCSGLDQRDGALCDAQRAIRLIRANAAKYSIDPRRVGIIGFSAGANLTIRTSTNWRKPFYASVDAADEFSCRPDFQLPIYPWDVRVRTAVEKNGWPKSWKKMEIDPAYPVDSETPPAFITQTMDDFCDPWTATAYACALKKAGVKVELKLYESGGHGYGLRAFDKPCDRWPHEASLWLMNFK